MRKYLTVLGALLVSIASYPVVADVSELELKANDIVIVSATAFAASVDLDIKTAEHQNYLAEFLWDRLKDSSIALTATANRLRSSGGGLAVVTIAAQHADATASNHVPRYVNPSGKIIS